MYRSLGIRTPVSPGSRLQRYYFPGNFNGQDAEQVQVHRREQNAQLASVFGNAIIKVEETAAETPKQKEEIDESQEKVQFAELISSWNHHMENLAQIEEAKKPSSDAVTFHQKESHEIIPLTTQTSYNQMQHTQQTWHVEQVAHSKHDYIMEASVAEPVSVPWWKENVDPCDKWRGVEKWIMGNNAELPYQYAYFFEDPAFCSPNYAPEPQYCYNSPQTHLLHEVSRNHPVSPPEPQYLYNTPHIYQYQDPRYDPISPAQQQIYYNAPQSHIYPVDPLQFQDQYAYATW